MHRIVQHCYFFCMVAFSIAACRENKTTKDSIARLEKTAPADMTAAQSDSLIQLYLAAAQEMPEDHSANWNYLLKAARLQYSKKEVQAAVGTADRAFREHGTGQPLTELARWYALLWRDYTHKDPQATRMSAEQVVQVSTFLETQQVWIDSALMSLDRQMGSPVVHDKAAAQQFIAVAETYADLTRDKNPDKSIDLLLKAAGLAKTIEQPERALELYQEVVKNGNKHAKTPTALFMMAFVYENDLNNLSKAKSLYEQFLRDYPNDPDFADDAKMALKMLGKSPEEIIQAAGN